MKYGRVKTIYTRTGEVLYVGEGSEELNKLPPLEREEALRRDKEIYVEVVKKEAFPYREKIILALQEYSGYFLFWQAYAYNFIDTVKARATLGEVLKRYPDSRLVKTVNFILNNARDKKALSSLIAQEFSKLANPVESYKPIANEPINSAMNNLKSALASSYEYGRWKKFASFVKDLDIPGVDKETLFKPALLMGESIVGALDGKIADFYYLMATDSVLDTQAYDYYCNLIIARYPHTSAGRTVARLKRMEKQLMEGLTK